MKNLKYALALCALIGTSFAYAGDYSQDAGFGAPVVTDKFQFQATLNGTKVDMTWKRFDSFSSEVFQYYKVIRSNSNNNPIYPEDGAIQYGGELGFTSHTDWHMPKEHTYYRVCVITEKKNRYCSNVVKIAPAATAEKAKMEMKYEEKKTEAKKEYKEVKKEYKEEKKIENGLSVSVKKQLDKIIANFSKKLQESSKTDAEKLEAISKVIERLGAVKTTKPALISAIEYLIKELSALKESYEVGDLE